MPIHQTKLMMANPHATGCVTAHIPVPFRNSHVTATSSMVAPEPATENRANQPNGVLGVSTMPAIFSVTDLNVCPCRKYAVFPGRWIGPGQAPHLRSDSFGIRSLGCHRGFNPSPANAPPACLRVRS